MSRYQTRLSATNFFLRQKYGLKDYSDKTKSITFEIIGSLLKNIPVSLDTNGAWMSLVMNTFFYTFLLKSNLFFSFQKKQLKKLAFQFSEPLLFLRV